MAIVADTHVHLYPCYNLDESFRRLQLGLRALGAGRPLVMLTERGLPCLRRAGNGRALPQRVVSGRGRRSRGSDNDRRDRA